MPKAPDRLIEAPARGPLLLDAAMGTRLIGRGLDLDGDDPSLWNLERPEEVARVHRLDVEAGADAITANTFGANRSWLDRFGRGDEVGAINRAAVALARREAGPDRLVLGCIGPTAGRESSGGRPSADREQAGLLAECGVDALILETNDAAVEVGSLRRRLRALRDGLGPRGASIPILVSFALCPDDRPLPHDLLGADGAGAAAVGWNCIPSSTLRDLLDRGPLGVSVPLIAQPSRGRGEPPLGDDAGWVGELLSRGVRLFGGCCGTTEEDIASLRRALGLPPTVGPSGTSLP